MFYLDFPKSQFIIPCPKTVIYNSCDQNCVTGDIFNDGGQLDERDDLRVLS